MRRPLWKTLVDLSEAAGPFEGAEVLRVTRLEVAVPLRIQILQTSEGFELLADAPRWRWPTAFDEKPGRLRVTFIEGETA